MKYETFATEMGFQNIGGVFVRDIDGYKIYFKDYQFLTLTIPSIYIPVDKVLTKEYIKTLTHKVDDNFCASSGFNGQSCIAVVSLVEGSMEKKENRDKLEAEIITAINALKEDGYNPMVKCPYDDVEAPYRPFGDDYICVTDEAREKVISDIKGHIASSSNKRYILSIALSIIFAGVGMIPALLLTLYKEYYFTGFVALMTLGSVLGLYLSKADTKKWLKITTAVIGFVFVVGFTCFSVPYMANARGLSLLDYMKYHKYQGLRKVIFSLIISLSGYNACKLITKKRVDYNAILKKFEGNMVE